MLGASQKDWLKQQLLQARDEYALIVWVNSVPWIGEAPKFSFVPEDNWSGYPEERREISDFLVRHEISNLIMLSGDAHMLAFDDGSHTNFSAIASGPGFPILHAAALDRQGSVKGGPYTLGPILGGGQFALVSVKDTGHELQVQLAGYDYVNRRLMELKFDVVSDGIRNLTVVE